MYASRSVEDAAEAPVMQQEASELTSQNWRLSGSQSVLIKSKAFKLH
jgi:hypothetical protein